MADVPPTSTIDVVTLTPNPAIDVSTAIDRVVPTRKLRCSTQQRDPGGGGINVARVIRRLGGNVAAVYPVGGTTGQLLRRLMAREGIPDRTVEIGEETREDFTVSELDTGKQYRFVLPGPNLAEHEWHACLEALAAFASRPRWLVASGSLPPGVPSDFYARVCRLAASSGTKMVLDTSGPALSVALAEGVHLLKPNLRELSELVGSPLRSEEEWLAACRRLIATRRADIVTLTLGHRGALLVTPDGAWRAPALPVHPVSTVGAGDSFLGGMVHGLAAGHSVLDAFRTAVAAGSATLLSPGTGLCRRADVETLYLKVSLEPM